MRPRAKSSGRLVAVLLLLATGYLYVQARRGAEPGVESGLRGLVESPLLVAHDFSAALTDRVAELLRPEPLRERVRELEAQLAEMTLANARVVEIEAENHRLGRLVGLRAASASEGIAARVVARDRGETLGSVLIDRGARDGLELDAAVVAPDGLVGRVIKLGDRTAVVQLVVAASSGVGVLDERSKVQGVLFGTGGDQCVLRYVPNIEDVEPGDVIRASGLDQIYPKGVVVGLVSAVAPGPDAFRVIHVTPSVKFRRLETVFVVVTRPAEGPLARATAMR